ncbi:MULTISPECIES: IclR family transcriptional regulator [unclassified Burkholderia]|uniref:IclR family transcriptional regulator n=1 Tax=unclassified Burkholderia TaxID=2613784 RepID=UPI001422A61D|nr:MULTISPECIES: IclR family transcriptional regulator [unclassified Burkholderia]NIE82372.1 IclR family transcriptional regulator [Burkholderia sp. Tr-860]NIF61658.1 IclR family transcriptional regulator [Burkholderia sp. Cy-647]NIF96180.1 IclR family transcriptional regulator [Burkholderia sp. Ax-1720]
MSKIATVNSVEHAIRLLELMAESPNVLSVSQMAQSLALPRATIYRLLRTLMQCGWVIQDDKVYRLSLRLAGLFRDVGDGAGAALAERLTPLLHQLVSETGETAHFAALDGDSVVYLAKVDSAHPIRMFSRVGWRGPLHATGAGKILLAWTDGSLFSRVCERELERFTPNTIVDKDRLQKELAKIRKQGYALDAEELIDGLTCVAVPVMDGEQIRGAISIAGPTARLTDFKAFADILKAALGTTLT